MPLHIMSSHGSGWRISSGGRYDHYCDLIMGAMASQITSLTVVYSTDYSDADKKKKHQVSAPLAFVWGIHRWPVNSPHKRPVTRKMFPFDDVIMRCNPLNPGRFNASPPGQNGRHFADDIFRCIFVMEKFCILSKISLKFAPWVPIDNNLVLVYIMSWRQIDKPLSEPVLTRFTDAYMRYYGEMSFD